MDLHSEVDSFSDNHALVTGAASSGEQKAAWKSRLVRGSYLDEVVNREEEGKEQHEASKQKDEPADSLQDTPSKAEADSAYHSQHATVYDQGLTWDFIPWLRKVTKLPILLKGILAPADAHRAVHQ